MIKKTAILLIIVIMFLGIVQSAYAENNADRVFIYVSLYGNDENEGTIEAPLATLKSARDKIRSLKSEGVNPAKGFVVYLREGNYQINEGLVLTEEDSGTAEAPIVYRSYPGEKATLVGGASISGTSFKKVEDETILSRIVDEKARNKVYCVDLKALGITELGEAYWPGAYSYQNPWMLDKKPKAASIELFVNGELQSLARYPNEGYMQVTDVIDPGAWPAMWQEIYVEREEYVPLEKRDPTDTMEIRPNDERYLKWTQLPENEALMYGFFRYDWADHTIPIKKIYPEEKKIESSEPGYYSVVKNSRFYVFNLLEEIDVPGEYFLDRRSGILYLYPSTDIQSADVRLSLLEDHLIHLENTQYVTFKKIDMTAIRSTAVSIHNGKYNKVEDCEITFTADKAIHIGGTESYRNGVDSCYIHDVNGGIVLAGGKLSTLTPAEDYAINCKIERFARITKGYNAAIQFEHVGNYAAYNEISGAAHLGVYFSGNNHKIYYNDIHHVVQEQDDMGAIYAGRSWIYRGTEIKYNYIHDLASEQSKSIGIFGIYLDDRLCETNMVGNVFENINGHGIFINGGRDNVILNNILVNVTGNLRLRAIIPPDPESIIDRHLENMKLAPYQNELWSKTYPALPNMLEDEPSWPKNNIVRNNLSVHCGKSLIAQEFRDNSEIRDNYETISADFYDAEGRNYLLKQDSEVFEKIPGFKQLPFTRMGTYTDRAIARVKDAVVLSVGMPDTFVSNVKKSIDTQNRAVVPLIRNNMTFVPLRYLAEIWGMTVEFSEKTRDVTLKGNNQELVFRLGETTVLKDGVQQEMPAAAFSEEGRTMVPLRAISEIFGKHVFWDDCGLIVISNQEDIFNTESDKVLINHLYKELSIY